jgi:hypothetical protein
MADNWVERKARRDQMLKDTTVWMNARTAVEECCASFGRHYSDTGSADCERINGHCTRVFVTYGKRIPSRPDPRNQAVVFIEILFHAAKPEITATVDEKVMHFPIDADEEHAFIFYDGREVSADEFSKLVLEGVLFVVPPNAAKHASP